MPSHPTHIEPVAWPVRLDSLHKIDQQMGAVQRMLGNAPAVPVAPRSDPPRYTPGQLVLVTLRHRETGRRGEVREYEQVRLGTVLDPPIALTCVRVAIPGCEDRVLYEPRDVADAGVGCR